MAWEKVVLRRYQFVPRWESADIERKFDGYEELTTRAFRNLEVQTVRADMNVGSLVALACLFKPRQQESGDESERRLYGENCFALRPGPACAAPRQIQERVYNGLFRIVEGTGYLRRQCLEISDLH